MGAYLQQEAPFGNHWLESKQIAAWSIYLKISSQTMLPVNREFIIIDTQNGQMEQHQSHAAINCSLPRALITIFPTPLVCDLHSILSSNPFPTLSRPK